MHKNLRLNTLLLVSIIFMGLMYMGCGSGGNKTATSGNTGSNSNNGTQTYNDTANPGYLIIDFSQGSSQANRFLSMSSNPATLSNPSNVRIAIRMISTQQTTDEFGDTTTETVTTYKKILDISTSTATSIPVAPGNGYKVEIISYRTFGDHNTMYKYGVLNGVNIVSGSTTNVTMTLSPIDANLQVPGSIPSGTVANVTTAPGYPLRMDKKYMRNQGTPIIDVFSSASGTTSFSFTTPALLQTDAPQTLYFQGMFLLDDQLLNSNETTTMIWRYYEPNPSELLDSQVTATILPPGSVGITITL